MLSFYFITGINGRIIPQYFYWNGGGRGGGFTAEDLLRLKDFSPITNKYIKLAIAYEKRHVKNVAIGDDGNEIKEVINRRMKETDSKDA